MKYNLCKCGRLFSLDQHFCPNCLNEHFHQVELLDKLFEEVNTVILECEDCTEQFEVEKETNDEIVYCPLCRKEGFMAKLVDTNA